MQNSRSRQIRAALDGRRCLVVVGLPGTGKSLWVREAARLAHDGGRRVHLLQWDVARLAWDTPAIVARFPEIDGVTHAVIRKALGLWVRAAIAHWFEQPLAAHDLLLVEAPLIGGRFAELAKRVDDPLESRLADETTLFVVVAPAEKLQQKLRARRAQELAHGRHSLEQHNASVAVLDRQVQAIENIAAQLGMTAAHPGGYDPDLYVRVLQAVLKHRRVMLVRPASLLPDAGSVYEIEQGARRIEATRAAVADTLARAAALQPGPLEQELELGWALT